MKHILAFVLFSIPLAYGQTPAPTNFSVAAQVTTPNLGSVLNWSGVAGATYNVYRAPLYDCKSTFKPIKIASGIKSTTYTDNPTPALPLGGECYAVTAVIGGVESGYSTFAAVFLGDKLYVNITSAGVGGVYPHGSGIPGATVTLYQDDVPLFTMKTNSGGSIVKVVRLLASSSYRADIVLPDGKHILLPAPLFGDFQPVEALAGSYNAISVDANGFISFDILQLETQPTQ